MMGQRTGTRREKFHATGVVFSFNFCEEFPHARYPLDMTWASFPCCRSVRVPMEGVLR